MQMQHDGGGGSGRQPVSSDITVSPGDIRDFARFLDEMASEIAAIETTMRGYTDGTKPVDFGHYYASAAAAARHTGAVGTGHDNLRKLHGRTDEIVEGTLQLARQYAELEELNRVTAAAVTAELDKRS